MVKNRIKLICGGVAFAMFAGLALANVKGNCFAVFAAEEFTEASSKEDLVSALALGKNVKITRDIDGAIFNESGNYFDKSTVSAPRDITIDLNGYIVGNFVIKTEKHNVTLMSSNKGKGSFYNIVASSPDRNASNGAGGDITIKDGVTLKLLSVNASRENQQYNYNLGDVNLVDGKLDTLIWNNAATTTRVINGKSVTDISPCADGLFGKDTDGTIATERINFNNIFKLGSNALYAGGKLCNSIDEIWDKSCNRGSWTFDNYGPNDGLRFALSWFEWKKLDFTAAPGAVDTTLTADYKASTVSKDKGTVELTTAYAERSARDSYYGDMVFYFYRSTDGGEYTMIGSSIVGHYEDTVDLGNHQYSYYASVKSTIGDKVATTKTQTQTLYSAPFAPSKVNIKGQHTAAYGEQFKLEASVSKPKGVNNTDNYISTEFKYQIYDDANSNWKDLSNMPVLKYIPANEGTKKFKLGVRYYYKGSQYSDWTFSDEFAVKVGSFETPTVKLLTPTNVKDVFGYETEIGVDVTNKDLFDAVYYKWYGLNDDGVSYNPFSDYASFSDYTFSGSTTNTFKVKKDSVTGTAKALTIRCQVTGVKNGYSVVANSEDIKVTFIELQKPVITSQPRGDTLSRDTSKKYELSVKASALRGAISYQWERKDPSATEWEAIDGATSNTYLVDRSNATSNLGIMYRCVASNAAGSAFSAAVYVIITDNTIIDTELDVKGLQVGIYDENQLNEGYVIDNNNHSLVCHLGDSFYIDYNFTKGNATSVANEISTEWRKVTGLNSAMGPGDSFDSVCKYAIDTSMAGTFEYKGRLYAEYDNGSGNLQTKEYNSENCDAMNFTVTVLGNDTCECSAVDVEIGTTCEIFTNVFGFENALCNGDVYTNAETDFHGNLKAKNHYHFVYGYDFYIAVPNEGGMVNYVRAGSQELYNESGYNYSPSGLMFDASAENLEALGIDPHTQSLSAYVVMKYQEITNEDNNGVFEYRLGKLESKQFTLNLIGECPHEFTRSSCHIDNTNDEGPEIFFEEVCLECEMVVNSTCVKVWENGSTGLPVIEKAATCTEDGWIKYKHFSMGDYDYYFTLNETTNKWELCANPSTLVIAAHHNYEKVDAKQTTCTEDGYVEHYYCEDCDTYFVLRDGIYYEVEKDTLYEEAYHKHLAKIDQVDPTYETYGVKEHYYCSHCDKYFSDAEGLHEIADLEAWKNGNGKIEKIVPEEPITPDTPNKGGLPAGAIAGIVIGSVAVAAGIGVGVFFLLKKKGVILKK